MTTSVLAFAVVFGGWVLVAGCVAGVVLALVLPAKTQPRNPKRLLVAVGLGVVASLLFLVADVPAVQIVGQTLLLASAIAFAVWVFWSLRRYRWQVRENERAALAASLRRPAP